MPPLSHSPSCSCPGTARPRLLKWRRVRTWMQEQVKLYRVCSWSIQEPSSSRPKPSLLQARSSGRHSRWATVRVQDVSASVGEVRWCLRRPSVQVQGVQSLQGLQLPQGQGQTQQLTLAPVQTLPLGQTGQVSLPNLQTVTVNSVSQGVQYTQGEEAKSPTGTFTSKHLHTRHSSEDHRN